MLHLGTIRQVGPPTSILESDDPIVRGFVEGRPELIQGAA